MRISTSFVLAAALSSVASAQVVINEVAYDAPGSDDGSVFVELFGAPGTDISGWTLQSIEGRTSSGPGTCNPDVFVFPAATLIPANGLVVVADGIGSTGMTNVANATFISNDIDLENGADALQLLDAAGMYVDAVAYGAVDVSGGPMSACNGQTWYEGNPARDVFAPLSIERCPAGADTNDNATDFFPNTPSPGVADDCCTAIEWVNQGFGNSVSAAAGENVGLDAWFGPCGANQPYLFLGALTDPAIMPPPSPFPVFDAVTLSLTGAANSSLFPMWLGTADARGTVVGSAFLDFSTTAVTIPATFTLYVGAVAFDQNMGIVGTNSVELVVLP